ncbi:TatD family hydrolase [Tellurirhabdus rosea]|uniref:TatD family hydrolase n=1 Tax=Tellurirhabdus rosea TaxID=2674997 RepID=UPI0022568D0A|nr:TatD family hydrolase [Tellurirhabdus rosea]
MTFIDTHAHFYDAQFTGEFDPFVARADEAGIEQIWLPNCARETMNDLMALADRLPGRCLPMTGLHPCYVTETVEDELAAVEDWLHRHPFPMIGEIGLDFYWDMTHVERQFEAFKTQLAWASRHRLPVSMHTRSGHDRNAFAEAADLIEKLALPNLTGIFHCFVGTLDEAQRAVEMGFKLGIGGVVTFKNGGLDKVIPHIGLEHLVLETDAPYLAPVPYRGIRNEPAYIPLIAQRIADLQQRPLAEVAAVTTANARRMIEF